MRQSSDMPFFSSQADLAGSKTLTSRQLRAADANKDGKVNVGDVTIIMQMCL